MRRRAFRKVCCFRFHSHLPQIQGVRRNPQLVGKTPLREVIRATGPIAKANPFRFSTKYQDDETDLVYYGFRYYTTSTARWIGRDPIEEAGGLNLYGFVNNDPLDGVDVAGQLSHKTVPLKDYWDEWKKCHPGLTQSQYDNVKKTLDRGCVGITCINLGEPGMPDMSNCYGRTRAGTEA